VKDERLPGSGWPLPAPLTLRLYAGDEVIFASDRHWLHPLFDLEAFIAQSGQDPTRTRLVDRITGRAAAFLVARLGIPELHSLLLSRRAIPVLEHYGIHYRCDELVDQIACSTEELLADTQDLEAACSLLQERRYRLQAVVSSA
jgi:zinc transport system ATP-binding protein